MAPGDEDDDITRPDYIPPDRPTRPEGGRFVVCPKCRGEGRLLVETGYTYRGHECDLCSGRKLVPKAMSTEWLARNG